MVGDGHRIEEFRSLASGNKVQPTTLQIVMESDLEKLMVGTPQFVWEVNFSNKVELV